jgi:hypothetical protein
MTFGENIVDLASYVRSREVQVETPASSPTSIAHQSIPSLEDQDFGDHTRTGPTQTREKATLSPSVSKGFSSSSSSGHLSAQILRQIDPDTDLAKFFDLAAQAAAHLEDCVGLMALGDNLVADDKFMASKQIFAELLMYRDISDAVGLIALKCFQAATQTNAITELPNLPIIMVRALHRVWAAPYMNYEDACSLAEEIEKETGKLVVPSYNEIASELIENSEIVEKTD